MGWIGRVVADASLEMKALIALLLIAAIAAVVLWVLGLRGRTRGLGFLAGWRAAGPLLGLAGAGYVLTIGFVALGTLRPAEPLFLVMAPGLAEAVLSLTVGVLGGGLAALAYGHLTTRGSRVAEG